MKSLILLNLILVLRVLADSHSVPLPLESERMAQFHRQAALFLISAVAPEIAEKVKDSDAEIQIPAESVSFEAIKAILAAREGAENFNHLIFRNAFSKAYLERRKLQRENFEIPEHLKDFPNFKNWEKEVVSFSRVKGQTRVIYRSPDGFVPTVRVAETLNTQDGNLEASVRETEMLIKRSRDAKNWDFYAYDSAGILSEESHFRPGMRPTPGICMSCHYSELDKSFSPIMNF
jgi:hypothetical protein